MIIRTFKYIISIKTKSHIIINSKKKFQLKNNNKILTNNNSRIKVYIKYLI